MSNWMVLTVRGKEGADYPPSRHNDQDVWDATADIVATMDNDSRVEKWTTSANCVHAQLACSGDNFSLVEILLKDYANMVCDAVVLSVSTVTEKGEARYYPSPTDKHTDKYKEIANGRKGELALAVINSRHGLIARDPFHQQYGQLDDEYCVDGSDQLETHKPTH